MYAHLVTNALLVSAIVTALFITHNPLALAMLYFLQSAPPQVNVEGLAEEVAEMLAGGPEEVAPRQIGFVQEDAVSE